MWTREAAQKCHIDEATTTRMKREIKVVHEAKNDEGRGEIEMLGRSEQQRIQGDGRLSNSIGSMDNEVVATVNRQSK